MMKAIKYGVLLLCVFALLLAMVGCGKEDSSHRSKQDDSSSDKGAASVVTPSPRYDDVMPEGSHWEEIDRADYARLPDSISVACRETNGHGYVLDVTVGGYNADLVIRCGVDETGSITGAVCVSSSETHGSEKEYGDRFKGKNLDTYAAVDTIAGSTFTTIAYKNAIKDALYATAILNGDTVSVIPESSLYDVDITGKGLPSTIQRVQKNGQRYIIEVHGHGFAYFGDDHVYQPATNRPIVIRVIITADGQIEDCATMTNPESQGFGSAWSDVKYYSQFDGKTINNYQDVDVVAGATMSNNAYLTAIKHCFEAVSILEGGAQ